MKDSIGGLWIKQGKNGKFMSGKITQMNGQDLNIIVFKNDKGDNERRPDYRIYLSEPRDGQQTTPRTATPSKTAPQTDDGFVDDIPY